MSMLHRSFKPAKCKTALKLAVSRIKLLKNKRDAQVRQLKRELAQLLESGQDHTARIRVEHVIREEKTMAAYDLVEIYCELIAARLPIIESQKNCPIDLKEPISSVIFASPRCSDIPELTDVRKHITAKYGKEFVSSALELRPDCGVSHLLIEKLSAKAPDGPTKIKILATIAEEHNVKWEPKSFGENDIKPSQDLLGGPNTFEKATYAEPSQDHVPVGQDDKVSPSVHASSPLQPMHDIPTPMHNIPTNSYEQNATGAARMAGGKQSTTPGTGRQEMGFRDSYSENKSAFPKGKQNWNMEFKDAASAAQAAAESAELASMAARAAAELSNRENMIRQYSSGSHSSSGIRLRDELPQECAFHDDKHIPTDTVNSTLHRGSSGIFNEQITSREQANLVTEPNEYHRNSHENVAVHARSASLKSSAFDNDNPFAVGSQMTDLHQPNNSFEQENSDLDEVRIKKQASRTEAGTELHGDNDFNTGSNYHFGNARTNRQSGKASSSHLSSRSDYHNDSLNLNVLNMGSKTVEDVFDTDEGNTQRSIMETNSYNDTSVVFDDFESEDDDYKFDADEKYKGEASSLFFSSPGIKSQVDPLENTKSWSHRQNIDEEEPCSSSQINFSVSERLTTSAVSSEKEDLLPVTFDDSEGSDSELDLIKSMVSETSNRDSVHDESVNHGAFGSSSRNNGSVDSDKKSWLSPSSVGSDTVEEHFEKKVDLTTESEKNFGFDDFITKQPSSEGRSSRLSLDQHASQAPDTLKDTKTSEESRIEESSMELSYGMLKGGLRNKGYRRPPYNKNTSNGGSSFSGNNTVHNERSLPTVRGSISSDAPVQDKYTSEVRGGIRSSHLRAHNTSDSYSHDLVANSEETPISTHEPRIQKDKNEAKKKSSSRASVTYFESDNSDSGDDQSNQNLSSLSLPVSGISRRTLAPSKTGRGLSSNDAPSKLEWKSSRVSYDSKTQQASSMMKSSENWGSSEPGSAAHAASQTISKTNVGEETMKSSASVQPPSSLPKTTVQDNEEGQKSSKSSSTAGGTPSKQKAGHVHPKLPDYDSFAAHFMSLKKGRQ